MSTNRDDSRSERRRVHRRQPRAGTTATCWWKLPATGPGQAAELQNISEDGLRLVVRKVLEPGSSIEVRLQPPDDGAPLVCLVQVVWCAASNAANLAGVRFLERLSEAELGRLT
jgi:hypothetical protein